MKWLSGLLLSLVVLVPGVKAEDLPPLPDNLCAEVVVELLRAVEEGLISEKHAEEIGGRCYRVFGERYRVGG